MAANSRVRSSVKSRADDGATLDRPVVRDHARRRRGWSPRVGALALVLACGSVSAAADSDPRGVWLTERDDAAVAIADCGLQLCGRIVWLKDATDGSGKPRADSENPEPAKRTRPICGLVVIDGLVREDAATWGGGNVYDPRSGKIYSGSITLLRNNTLRVNAFLGLPVFGQSQIWKRAEDSAAGLVDYNCRYVRVPPPVR
jgi:uncharacterized protein (DUF2147 family)